MLVIYNSFRKALALVVLVFFVSCQLIEEQKVEAERNLWFEQNTKQLDQLYLVPQDGLSDSLSNWLIQKVRFLNHFEPFCKLVKSANDTTYQVVFEQKALEEKPFTIEVKGNRVLIFYQNESLFYSRKDEFLNEFKALCNNLFVNQRKNTLLQSGYLKKEFSVIEKLHPWTIKLPDDFKIVRHKEKFLWVRTETTSQNSHLLIHREQYKSEQQFEFNALVQLRDSLARNNIFYKKGDSTSYMETELYYPLQIETNSFGSFYGKRMTGGWSINKETKGGFAMGGYFLGYALVDKDNPGEFYYLEAFFSAPNVNKLPYIRTLEAILRTFELNKQPI
jgi:hypothetical protein